MKQSGMPSCHICRVMGKAQPRKNPQRSSSKACINFIHNTSRKVSDVSFFSFGARHAGLAFWVLFSRPSHVYSRTRTLPILSLYSFSLSPFHVRVGLCACACVGGFLGLSHPLPRSSSSSSSQNFDARAHRQTQKIALFLGLKWCWWWDLYNS